jgi:hypothetical protein
VYGLFADGEAAGKAARSLQHNDMPAQVTVTMPRAEYWKEIFPAKA